MVPKMARRPPPGAAAWFSGAMDLRAARVVVAAARAGNPQVLGLHENQVSLSHQEKIILEEIVASGDGLQRLVEARRPLPTHREAPEEGSQLVLLPQISRVLPPR